MDNATLTVWIDQQIKATESKQWNMARSTDQYRKGQLAGQLQALKVVRARLTQESAVA
jgi:hypothetical protein